MATPDWDSCMQEFGWFDQLSSSETTRLGRVGTCEDFGRGELIFSPTREPSSVFLLRSGLVRISRLGVEGDEVTFGFVAPGEVFGELSALWELPRESFATAVQPSRVCRLPREDFHELATHHVPLLLDVVGQIAKRFKRMERRVEQLVLEDVYTRAAGMLLELCEDFGSEDRDGYAVIDLPLTQSDLAQLIGATRQTVNSSVRRLQNEGLLMYERRRFVLPKPHELSHVVYGSTRA